MRKFLFIAALLLLYYTTKAQMPIRPDAFPPKETYNDTKSLLMASSIAEMYDWNRYPTYETYVAMMQQFASDFPTICHLDTIGVSINNRLILCVDEECDYFVLNSVGNLKLLLPYLTHYDMIHCYLDNDDAGIRATKKILAAYEGHAIDESQRYKAYNDINDVINGKMMSKKQ